MCTYTILRRIFSVTFVTGLIVMLSNGPLFAVKQDPWKAQSEKYIIAFQAASQKANQLPSLQEATTTAQGQMKVLQNQLETLKIQKESLVNQITVVRANIDTTRKNFVDTKVALEKIMTDLRSAVDAAIKEARTETEISKTNNLKDLITKSGNEMKTAISQIEQNLAVAEAMMTKLKI